METLDDLIQSLDDEPLAYDTKADYIAKCDEDYRRSCHDARQIPLRSIWQVQRRPLIHSVKTKFRENSYGDVVDAKYNLNCREGDYCAWHCPTPAQFAMLQEARASYLCNQ